jgi:hypothetical protein
MTSAYEHGPNAARHGKHIRARPFDTGTLKAGMARRILRCLQLRTRPVATKPRFKN